VVFTRRNVVTQCHGLSFVPPRFSVAYTELVKLFFDKLKQTVCSTTEHKKIGG
jgi:hypothetical protein